MVVAMDRKERERFSALLKEIRGDDSMRGFCSTRDLHYAAWRQWESCLSVPGYENLQKVATLKGWTMDQLLAYLRTGDENENPLDIEQFVTYIKGLPDGDRLNIVKQLL